MNGHINPTQKPESKLEITETPVQRLPDNELDAIAGGITFSDLLVSSYQIDLGDIIISSLNKNQNR